MALRADKALAQYIADNTGSDLILRQNLFNGPVRGDLKGRQCNCILESGLAPVVCHDGAPARTEFNPAVLIRLRSDRACYDSGLDLAKTIHRLVHLAAPVTDSNHPLFGFLDCRVVESAPSYLGETNDGEHEWSMTVDLQVAE